MIYWIASYPKSGSTWIRMFLSAYRHGQVNINSPAGFELDDVSPGNYQIHLRKPVNELTPTEFLLVRPVTLMDMCHVAQNKRVFVKTHNGFASIDDIPLIPRHVTEGALYMVRDPRDIVISYAAHCNQSIDRTIEVLEDPKAVAGTGRGTYHALFAWHQHVQSWLDCASFPRLVVRYEDMLEKPEKTYRYVLTHLGWDIEEGRLRKALELTKFKALQQSEKKEGFREASKVAKDLFFRSGRAGGWKDVLTEKQVKRIEDVHGDTMDRLKYTLEG